MGKHNDMCIKNFECDVCGQKFMTKSILSNHKWYEHKETRKKAYTCSICGRVLNKRQS